MLAIYFLVFMICAISAIMIILKDRHQDRPRTKNPRKTACRICFAVIAAITFILWCIWFAYEWKNAIGDDIFPAHFMMLEFGLIFLAIPIVQEFIVYKSVSYFWAAEVKTPGKTWFYIGLLIVDLVVHVGEFDRYLTFFDRKLFQMLFG